MKHFLFSGMRRKLPAHTCEAFTVILAWCSNWSWKSSPERCHSFWSKKLSIFWMQWSTVYLKHNYNLAMTWNWNLFEHSAHRILFRLFLRSCHFCMKFMTAYSFCTKIKVNGNFKTCLSHRNSHNLHLNVTNFP